MWYVLIIFIRNKPFSKHESGTWVSSMEHMRYLTECFFHVGYLFRYVYKSVCRFLICLLLIVSAFCKRLSDMTMYMWLITLQKKINIVALVFIYGSDFVFPGRFLLGYGSLWPFVIRSRLFQNENQDHECLILSPSNIFGSQRVPIWILVYRCFSGLGAAV